MLSLCMIVKDEEETLDKCLNSVDGLVDEIIIIDTGSKDRTKEIGLKYTNNVFDFIWCNDFSKARNFAIAKASNEWILVLDADEVIKEYKKESLTEFCKKNKKNVGRIKRINIYEDKHGSKRYIERVNRVFNKSNFEYEGIIHEQVVEKNGEIYSTNNIDLCVDHIGYSKEVLNRTNKIKRNIELLSIAIDKSPYDPYTHYQLGKSYFMGKDFKNAYIFLKKALALLDNFKFEYAQDLIESYGYTLIELKLFSESLDLYKYEKYYSNYPDFIFLLGIIEMNNGNFQKAAETFLKCTEFNEGRIEGITSFLPLYNIGVIFDCLGFKEEACDYYKMCGNYEPAIKQLNTEVFHEN